MLKNLTAMQETQLIPGVERFPGVGNGNPLQYSCLGNAMDRKAWRATVHKVTKSQRHTHRPSIYYLCTQSSQYSCETIISILQMKKEKLKKSHTHPRSQSLRVCLGPNFGVLGSTFALSPSSVVIQQSLSGKTCTLQSIFMPEKSS